MERKDEKRKRVLTREPVILPQVIPLKPDSDLSVVGQPVSRTDARLKATGKLAYGADYPEENFLHGKILRSPLPHAGIRSIRIDRAKELPGVVAVLLAKDVPGRNGFGVVIPDQPVVCGEKVRFVGDAVALVAAETEAIAQKALSLIEVDYDPLPPLFDPRESLKPGALPIHENGNLLAHHKLRKGDVEKGFSEADVILERTYKVPFVEHGYLEPDMTMAIPQADGTILIQGPMQAPFSVRRNVAAVLGVSINGVRVKSVSMGGGFGGKEDAPIDIGCRAAVLAAHTKRPVRISLEREEVTLQTAKRHPHIMEVKVGAQKDGRIVAFQGIIYNEKGAYASLGPLVNIHSAIMMPGPYEIPNCKVDAYLCYTNHPFGGAMRGFGAPQVCFAHESMMDELALELGMNPLEIRRKNAFRLGSTTATGQILKESMGLREAMEACSKAFNWDQRYRESGYVDAERSRRRGVGMALGFYRTSIGAGFDGCGANVYVHEDGSVLLYTGITELGQGSFTVLSQICAEELGIEVEDIRLVSPDTDLVPDSGPTVGSRSTTLMGNAIILAARQVKESLMEMASQMLFVPVERLEARNRRLYDRENPGRFVSFRDAAARCMAAGKRLIGQGWWTPPPLGVDPETLQGDPYFVYSYSAQMAEVIVDVQTGEVEVIDHVAAFDIGKAVNPQAVEGQVEGGLAMGLGYALMEEVVLKDGRIQNLNLQDFLIPTALDVPDMKPIILEMETQYGPYGAKGVGEMPNIPAAPAIINAVAHACGGRVRSLPASPEKVYWAMKEAGKVAP
ncbi:MAG TPA: xanthine dehydrogenase family protein molybdopterin-binding subunit [Thermodesulfobacteriota bacterium]|nr:xanthine dehydrogenase family protein molybdopterin-binding subunit [Thermodesulfobacteriota bacterium]